MLREAIFTTAKVIGVHLLNFKPIFDPSLKENVRGTPIPGGGYASKTVIL